MSEPLPWDAIGAISELAGAVAVVVTIFVLIGQLRANTKQMKSESYRALYSDYQALIAETKSTLNRDWPEISAAYENWEAASPRAQALAHPALCEGFLHLAGTFKMLEQGTINDSTYEAFEKFNLGLLGYPGALQWWSTVGQNVFEPTFVFRLNEQISKEAPVSPDGLSFYDAKNWRDT